MTLYLNYCVASDRGLVRGNNEDSAYAGPHLLALADGMGGHAAGEVASQIMITHMRRLDVDPGDLDMLAVLGTVADEGNRAIAAQVRAHPDTDGMGTTLTALMFDGRPTDSSADAQAVPSGTFGMCHVGDSRGYRLREGALEQITIDDTFVQSLVDQGELDPEDVCTHPQRSLILKAYTGRPVEPTLQHFEARLGDRVLLCSDGLSDPVTASTIETTLKEGTVEEAARRLVELALRSGGPDNVTVVVADVVDDSFSPRPSEPMLGGAVAGEREEDPRPDTAAGRAAMMAARTPKTIPPAVTPVLPDNGPAGSDTPPGGGAGGDAGASGPGGKTAGARGAGSARRAVTWLVVAVVLLAVGGGVWAGARSANNHYFLTSDDQGRISIERGLDYTLFGASLHHTHLVACLNDDDEVKTVAPAEDGSLPSSCTPFVVDDLPPAVRGSVNTTSGGSFSDMVDRVSALAEQALPVCVTREPADGSSPAATSTDPSAVADTSTAATTSSAPASASASASESAAAAAAAAAAASAPSSSAAATTAREAGDLATPGVNCRKVRG